MKKAWLDAGFRVRWVDIVAIAAVVLLMALVLPALYEGRHSHVCSLQIINNTSADAMVVVAIPHGRLVEIVQVAPREIRDLRLGLADVDPSTFVMHTIAFDERGEVLAQRTAPLDGDFDQSFRISVSTEVGVQ